VWVPRIRVPFSTTPSRTAKGLIAIERTYDRVPQFDERSKLYHIRALIGEPEIRQQTWTLGECLDQGQQGACVGFGWTHELLAEPVRIVGEDPFVIYHQAQTLDDIPGENYEGTSVLAGAKAVQARGHMTEYRWAFSTEDVLATLSVHGPVVIGINWHAGMEETDEKGYIRPDGDVRGGHCVCLHGVIVDKSDEKYGWSVLGKNSWGASWGISGDFVLRATDLESLQKDDGEVCVPVVRVPSPTPATPVATATTPIEE